MTFINVLSYHHLVSNKCKQTKFIHGLSMIYRWFNETFWREDISSGRFHQNLSSNNVELRVSGSISSKVNGASHTYGFQTISGSETANTYRWPRSGRYQDSSDCTIGYFHRIIGRSTGKMNNLSHKGLIYKRINIK